MSQSEKLDLSQALTRKSALIEAGVEGCHLSRPERNALSRALKLWADIISRLCLPNDYCPRRAIAEIVPQASPNN